MNKAKQLIELIDPDINVDRFGSRVDITRVETFVPAEADAVIQKLKDGIQAPHKNIYKSTLGGIERTSIMITLSLDPKEEWKNGILQNSRYCMFHYNVDGSLEQFSRQYNLPKFRKTRVKSVDDAIAKINAYINTVGGSHES
jgi:hypothetical protein